MAQASHAAGKTGTVTKAQPDKLESAKILQPSELRDLSKLERLIYMFPHTIRQLGAFVIVCAAFVMLWMVIFSVNPELSQFRQSAWTLMAGLVGAAFSSLFGPGRPNKSD